MELKMNTSIFLTGKEIAEILKISKALAYRLIANGEIPSVRFGRTVRVKQEDLESFLQKCATPQENDIDKTSSPPENG
jgi:excisionase family DNA binding protein